MEIFKTESETRSGSEGVDDHCGSEEPRKNQGRGWGVRCAEQNVKRGTVLGCYTGWVLFFRFYEHLLYIVLLDSRYCASTVLNINFYHSQRINPPSNRQ